MERYDTTEYDRLYNTLITPFEQGSFDVDREELRALVRYNLETDGFSKRDGGFIVNPEAGEIFYLTREERRRNVRAVVDEVDGEIPVFAGVYGVRPESIVKTAEDAVAEGADGLFVLPPAGTIEVTDAMDPVAHPEIWVDHVRRIAEVADVPVIVHPTAPPSTGYGGGLPLEPTLEVLREVPSVVGWKMIYSPNTFDRVAEAMKDLDRHVAVLGARATYFHHALSLDLMDGMVTGSLNYALEPILAHYDAWRRQDVEHARQLWREITPLQNYVYHRSRLHIRYKVATWLRGLTPHPYMRPPMPKPTREEIETLDSLVREAGLSTIPHEQVEDFLEDFDPETPFP